MTIDRVFYLLAVILFALAALGESPSFLDDIDLVPAGLAFGFAALLTTR